MSLSSVEITGFRSIRKLRFPVRRLSVLVGGNGVGKTNLYRGLQLLHAAATGTIAQDIAREGGLGSISWAGERLKGEHAGLQLAVTLDNLLVGDADFAPTYRIEIGFPPRADPTGPRGIVIAAFELEAQIKLERLSIRQGGREIVLMERKGPSAWTRDDSGARRPFEDSLLASETALSAMAGAGGFSELALVRNTLAQWRFYHGFRTDMDSVLRRPSLAVTAPLLAPDGSNLAAVFATLRHIRGDTLDLDTAIDDAFPGARLLVPEPETDASFAMLFPETPKRPFQAHELSDGTLHFLALCGALLSYRLPPFIALNEPETSLHPELLPALARMIARAAERSQIWVVTHSRELAEALAQETGSMPRQVIRRDGATWLEGLSQLGTFPDDED